jgi:shikimate kinase
MFNWFKKKTVETKEKQENFKTYKATIYMSDGTIETLTVTGSFDSFGYETYVMYGRSIITDNMRCDKFILVDTGYCVNTAHIVRYVIEEVLKNNTPAPKEIEISSDVLAERYYKNLDNYAKKQEHTKEQDNHDFSYPVIDVKK